MGFSIGKALGGAVKGFVGSGGNWAAAAVGGLAAGASGDSGVGKATNAANAGLDQEIAYNRESRDIALGLNAPFQNASYSALNAMMSMNGLPQVGGRVDQGGRPVYDSARIGTQQDAIRYAVQLGYEGDDAENMGRYIWDKQNGLVQSPTRPTDNAPGSAIRAAIFANSDPYGGMAKEFDSRVAPLMSRSQGQASGGEYNWQTNPGYAFRLAEGEKALERRQAAGGSYLSGGAIREALRYNQNFATEEFNNIYNRLSAIAGFGPTVAANSGSAALRTGAQMGLGAASQGYNRASAYTAKGQQKDDYLAEILTNVPDFTNGGITGRGGIIWN